MDAPAKPAAWYDPTTRIVHLNRDEAPRGAVIWPLTAQELADLMAGEDSVGLAQGLTFLVRHNAGNA